MNVQFVLDLVLRWLHILAAITAVGGAVFVTGPGRPIDKPSRFTRGPVRFAGQPLHYFGLLSLGTFGLAGAYSFFSNKNLPVGEGGMLVTDDTAVWERAWAYKDHGKSWDAVFRRSHPPGFRWLHESFGTNWRMTEMQAAIGRLQLRKLPGWLERRTANARLLADALAGLPGLRVSMPGGDVGHAWYKFYAYLRPEALAAGWDRDRVIEAVTAEGVPCFSGSCGEIYREQAFVRAGWGPGQPHPVAGELAGTSVMFLVHPTLGDGEMRDAAAALRKVLAVAARPT